MKRRILVFLGILFLIWFIVPFILYGILNAGNMVGTLISALVLLYGINLEKVNMYIRTLWQKGYGKVVLSGALILCAVVTAFVVWGTVKIIGASVNHPQKETTVVVLGCQVKPNGPSLMLKERLDAAYDYLTENPELKCVLSGGQGDDEPMSEAQAMYKWLVDKGIDKKRLYLEDKSTSTRENLLFSAQLIKKEGLISEITIITNEFHQYRASEIAKDLEIESYSVSAGTLITFFPAYFVRELGGILYELIK